MRAMTQHYSNSRTESWKCLILSQPWKDDCGSQMSRVWNGPSLGPYILKVLAESSSVPFFNHLISVSFWQVLIQKCDSVYVHSSVQKSVWLSLCPQGSEARVTGCSRMHSSASTGASLLMEPWSKQIRWERNITELGVETYFLLLALPLTRSETWGSFLLGTQFPRL